MKNVRPYVVVSTGFYFINAGFKLVQPASSRRSALLLSVMRSSLRAENTVSRLWESDSMFLNSSIRAEPFNVCSARISVTISSWVEFPSFISKIHGPFS